MLEIVGNASNSCTISSILLDITKKQGLIVLVLFCKGPVIEEPGYVVSLPSKFPFLPSLVESEWVGPLLRAGGGI